MVRVLLDATAVPADRRGVGRYVDGLLPALAGVGADVRVVCQPPEAAHFTALTGRPALVAPPSIANPAARLIWEQTALPRLIEQAAPDVVHAPHYTHALRTRRPLVVTLHDATFFTDPGVHTTVKAPFFRAATRLALRHAACCIVPSQATADELVRVAGAEASRLHVAYHGVDTTVFAPPLPSAVAGLRSRLGLADGCDYVAFLGTIEPRKNVPALIRGWVAACVGRAEPPALVLAGAEGWDADDYHAAVASVPAPLSLLRPGYLPFDELPALLGGAAVVAYPSLAEGFGLPVLEAMACGAAVLTTRRSALPEVGGEAVAYTEPDAAAIAITLTELLDDAPRRAALGGAGVERAGTFTWEACAHAHLRAYERAAAQGPRGWR